MADDILTKKRITEYEETATASTLRSDDVMFVDGQTLGTRKMSLLPILNNLFKSSGISVTDANYSTTITDVNSQPVNTIYTYAANLQSKILNLPSNFAVTILHYTPIFQASTAPGQVMLAIERTGDNKSLYFRTTSGSPAAWSDWVKVANSSDVDAIKEELDDLDIETDKTLTKEGKPADAKAAGDAIDDLKANLNSTNEALELIIEKNLCTGVQESTRYTAWNDGNAITTTTDTSYIGAVIPLNGKEYISLNQNWIGPSYSFFADSDDKRISRVVDGKTADSGYVYAVPANAVKVYLSQNVANVNITRGLVAFEGKRDLTGNEYTVANYSYGTTVSHVGILDNLEIKYSQIKDAEVNIADGTFTAMSNGTLSGNTVTVTAAYSGIRSNEFSISNLYIKVSVKSSFNVPGVVMRLQANANGTWATVSGVEFALSNNTEFSVSFKPTDYVTGASRYRLIFQNTGMTAGVTNTITIESLSIYDASKLETLQGYNSDFEVMLDGMLGKLVSVQNIYHVAKDRSGDFTSFVEAIEEATKYMDSVVYVGAGTFDLLEELGSDYVQNPSSSKKGVVLKNRVHVICSSQTVLLMNNTGSVLEYLSPINTGVYGCTLENATIIDNGVRYSVHDDLGGSGATPYINRFINCTMIHKNGMYGDCIGGGLGENGDIEIRGCYFEGDSTVQRLVYYHGNNNASVTDAKCRLVVADNYFSDVGTFKMTKYGQSTEVSTAYVSNNSFGSAPAVDSGSDAPYDNVAIVQWNNEIRTS